jgi:hypothetical protein
MRKPIFDQYHNEIGYTCDQTGKCFFNNESLSASSTRTVKKMNRLENEKSLSELLIGEKPYASE